MPETQISENGEWLRIVANWFEQRAKARKASKKEAKFQRSEKIYLNGDESKWEEFKYYVQQASRSGSFSLNKLLQGLSQMANVGFVDNAILRKIEKGYAESNHDESKFVQWLKKHPALSSYLSYYTAIALIGTMTWGGIKINNIVKDKEKDKKEIINNEIIRKNVELFEQSRSKIKFSLVFGENYYPYVYFCGKAWTTGHGLTVLYDADGSVKPVTKNTKTLTMEESDVRKGRYLTYEILPDIKNLIRVPLDEKTLIAACMLRYCVGHDNFKKSQFLKQLNQGKTGKELAKTLTGWRQQSGVLQRCYFFAAIMCDEITFDDLLDLRAEGCYNLKLKDIVVYSNGEPKVDNDGFYQWDFSGVRANLETAKNPRSTRLIIPPAAKGKKNRTIVVDCKMVKEIVPDYIWEEVSGTKKNGEKIDKKTAFVRGTILLQNKTFGATPLFVSSDKEFSA